MSERANRRQTRARRWQPALLLGLVIAAGAAAYGVRALVPRDREARLERLDLEALRREVRGNPNDALVFLVLGRRFREAGEQHKAFVITHRAYDLNDRDPRFVAAMAGALVDAGDVASAHRLAEYASTRWPNSGEVRAQYSRAFAARGDFTGALREAEVAVRLAPGHAEAWRALGNGRTLNKRPEDAFNAFARAAAQAPRDSELLADYGDALARYGRAAEAERVLRRAMEIAPAAPRPVALLGQLLADRAQTQEERTTARALLQRALEQAPGATDTAYALARLELESSRPRDAIRLLKSCLARDPGYGEAYLALGRAYQAAGDPTAARRAFARWRRFSDERRERAHLELRLRRSPNDPALLRRLEQLRSRTGSSRGSGEPGARDVEGSRGRIPGGG
jgi:tetratricopeptide (TPR) repeat protein